MLAEITDDVLTLSAYGEIVQACWQTIPEHHPTVERCDEFIVMPNHVHGILILNNPDVQNGEEAKREFSKPLPGTLSTIVGSFKSAVTKAINELRQSPGEKVWQRGFYECIIRNESALKATREYIINNPLNWIQDRENPAHIEK